MPNTKSDTKKGERVSGPAHTKDYDDTYGAGESRIHQQRETDSDYHNQQPRVGGRKREVESIRPETDPSK